MSTTPTAPPPGSRRRWRLVLLLALVVIVAGAGWWWRTSRGPVPPAVPAGVHADVAAAITTAREEVIANRKSASAWGRLGLVFTAHNFDDQAADCYREAHNLDKTDDRWPYMLALYSLSQKQDNAAALRYLETASESRHRSPSEEGAVRLRLAELYLAEHRLGDAERLFRAQLARDPADDRALLGLGMALLTADRPADAIEPLTGATNSPFTRRKATSTLAAAHRLLGNPSAAAKYELQVAQLPEDITPPDPFAAEAAELRAGWRGGFEEVAALEKEGRFRDTIPLLSRMAEDPSNVRAAVVLGQHLSLLGEHAAAERYLRAVYDRDPENVQAALLLGTVLYDLAQTETGNRDRKNQLLRDSAGACERAVKLKPDLAMAHFCRGMAVRGLGDLPNAVGHFRLAVECRPEVPQMQLGLLLALVESGQIEEARTRLPVALKIVPADDPRLIDLRKRIENPAAPGTPKKP